MEKIICAECGTENEKEFEFCKNCGTKLNGAQNAEAPSQPEFINSAPNQPPVQGYYQNSQPQQPQQPQNTAPFINNGGYYGATPPAAGQPQAYQNPYNYQQGYRSMVMEIDGVPTADVAAFVGKNSYTIVPKMEKMTIEGKKISWCTPPAILGFFFGPIGAAIWFFYRKMYSIALILLAVGTALSITSAVLNYEDQANMFGALIDWSERVEDSMTDDETMSAFDELLEITGTTSAKASFATMISWASSILTLILAGLFSMNAYKEHAVNKIRQCRASAGDMRYYSATIASLGGTSGGMLALGIVLLILIPIIISSVSVVMAIGAAV